MAPEEMAARLVEPFEPSEVKFKPQTVSGNRALAIPFVDARVIQDRLDEVLGVMGWQDHYESLPEGSVICRLKVRIGDEWITKEDVGSQSEQPDEGDRRKAAFSDALKRAAVKFGIGRYLYRCKPQWVDYDPQKKQIVKAPQLPAWALPRPAQKPAAPPAAETKAEAARPPAQPASVPVRLRAEECEQEFVARGWCEIGDLIDHLEAKLGDLWEQEAEADIRHEIKAFQAARKSGKNKAVPS